MSRQADFPPLSRALVKARQEASVDMAIQNLVTEVRRKTDQFDIPVAPERIARLLGAIVEPAYLEAEGVLEEDNPDGPRILTKRPKSWTEFLRWRFTMAHEVGHLVLRRELRAELGSAAFEAVNAEEERLCNRFAAELLMPANALRPQLLPHARSPSTLVRIAATYAVSVQSLATRTVQMWPRRSGSYWAVLWHIDRGQIVTRWACPREICGATLFDTGHTPVERAFTTREEKAGPIRMRIGGQTVSSKVRALGLGGGKSVLMVAIQRDDPFKQRYGKRSVRHEPA
jgi:hypothetical protein